MKKNANCKNMKKNANCITYPNLAITPTQTENYITDIWILLQHSRLTDVEPKDTPPYGDMTKSNPHTWVNQHHSENYITDIWILNDS